MSAVSFNINDYVRVRLTATGKLIHRRQHDSLRKEYASLPKYRRPETDADGFSRWQLWHLMQVFGPSISLGGEPPFETAIWFDLPSPAPSGSEQR